MAVKPWERQSKELPRSLAVRPIGRRVRTALFLPGRRAHCVRAALEAGTIDTMTRLVLVERDEDTAAEMRRIVRRLGFNTNPYYHVGQISSLCLRGVLGSQGLDFAFLDFCAPLTTARADWVYNQLGPVLADNASVALTLLRTVRNCHFMAESRKYLLRNCHELVRAHRAIAGAEYVGTTDVGSRTTQAYAARNWVLDDLVPFFHDTSVTMAAIMQGLLPHHRGVLDTCIEYKTSSGGSGSRMGMIRISKLHRDQLSRSRLLDVLAKLVATEYSPILQR